ncbi:putative Adaptin N terminal region-domain-containing protein [Seiridium cardinale]|uniref:Adaptin N terminal region-domain-containing protein n=1 Tax=Seiridium cardinale TaxID=138064 RepID=A0ABR2XX14_9PEZI
MKYLEALGTVALLVFGISTVLAQSDTGNTVSALPFETSTALQVIPKVTSSKFTTFSFANSYARPPTSVVTASPTIQATSLEVRDFSQNKAVAPNNPLYGSLSDTDPRELPGQVMQEQSHETLTTVRAYGTITITLLEAGSTIDVTYTGSINVESMVTLESGTHTTTERVETTVTDDPPNFTATTTVSPSISSGTASTYSHSTDSDTAIIPNSHSTKEPAASITHTPITSSATTTDTSTMTESTAGVAPTLVEKTIAVLGALAAVALAL